MKGLLIKDLLAIKRQGRIILAMLVFYVIYAAAFRNISMLSGMIVMLCAMMPITAMAYDEKCKWDKYALAMPIPRKTVVLSKYLFGILLDAAGVTAVIPFSMAISFFTKAFVLKDILLTSAVVGGLALVFLALILPVMFKFGVEKGRLLMMLAIFVPVALVMIAAKLGIQAPSEQTVKLLMFSAPAAVAAMLFASYKISAAIYAKKEF